MEDNLDNLKLVMWTLEDEGYEIDAVRTGEACLERIDQNPYDIVLIDISLPGIDGKEVTRRLRRDPRFESLPIIALTAHAIKGEDEKILSSGIKDLITKPIDLQRLLELVRRYTEKEE